MWLYENETEITENLSRYKTALPFITHNQAISYTLKHNINKCREYNQMNAQFYGYCFILSFILMMHFIFLNLLVKPIYKVL